MASPTTILKLQMEYREKSPKQVELLKLVREVEIFEEVFHSNAIENSTLTLSETEQILLDMGIDKIRSIREVYEAKNLYRVYNYIENKKPKITLENVLLCHKFLLDNINEDIAGRIREGNENVRVGKHIAPTPVEMEPKLNLLLDSKIKSFKDVIAFHIDFECLHPFVDGNGRIGRVLINWQLKHIGLPPVIIRSETKVNKYYSFLANVDYDGLTKASELLLSESINKRLAYIDNLTIITLAQYSEENTNDSLASLINRANRQTIPAFRMRGVWSIGIKP